MTLTMRVRVLAAGLLLAAAPLAASAASFTNYPAPAPLGTNSGEPSIGVDPKTGAVMFVAGLQTLKITFDAAGTASWSDVTGPLTGITTLDPILYTDPGTGRTFVSQLLGATSAMEYTDNDGASWTPSLLGVTPGIDHQTVGGGPYPASGLGSLGKLLNASYPNAIYYCSQGLVDALCLRSDTGGLSFGPPVPVYSLLQCGGLHGHVKVAPDGTVYLPNKDCSPGQAVAVSANAGTSWTIRNVPGTTTGTLDPAVGTGRDGTLYVALIDGNGKPKVAVSTDKGASFAAPVDLGALAGVVSAVFPTAVAGDGDRAAVGFLGTSTPGNYEALDFPGVWYAYIGVTYDRGKTWTVTNITPNDPVQREGGICVSGTTCGANRNLLDFNDMVIDAQGRVLMGYADGCIGTCATGGPASRSALATVARQSGGLGLLSAFDH